MRLPTLENTECKIMGQFSLTPYLHSKEAISSLSSKKKRIETKNTQSISLHFIKNETISRRKMSP